MVNTKDIKGLPTLGEEDVVTIWKLNFGFTNDMQAESVEITMDSMGKKTGRLDPGKAKLYWLLYGIYESTALGILPIKDVALPMSEAEKTMRMKVVRTADAELLDKVYSEILEFNNPKKDEKTDTVKND